MEPPIAATVVERSTKRKRTTNSRILDRDVQSHRAEVYPARWLAIGLLLVASSAWAQQPIPTKAEPTFPCFKHHGRLMGGLNGITTRLWLIGTNRVLAVDGG